MDMVVHHNGRLGRNCDGVMRPQSKGCGQREGAWDRKPDGADLVQGINHCGGSIYGRALILITEVTTSVMAKLIETYHVSLNYQADLNSKSGLLGRAEQYLNVIFYTPWWLVLPLAFLLMLVAVVMARLVNANKFSLHGMYRDRLIRAYLGASNSDRKPNPFT